MPSPAPVEEIVALRRDLHAHPELGYEETRTAGVVAAWLAASGVEVRSGLAGGTGVLGRLPATRPGGRTVALRADMDALPIREDTGLGYESRTPGRMHACGHDGHVAILLGAARALAAEPDRPNDVVFIFQPAEEGGAGGERMVRDGAMDGVDAVYGLHGWPDRPLGEVSTRVGPVMAAAERFRIVVHGRGGHAAYPHLTVDPVVTAAHLVTALQSVVARNVGPLESAVVSVGKIAGGDVFNVIPETAELWGTLRTLDEGVRARVRERIGRLAESVPAAFGAEGEIEWEEIAYPATINDAEAVERLRAASPTPVWEVPEPSMAGEDFAFYGRAGVPACFAFLGLLPPGQTSYPGLHTPQFDFNDAAIPAGVGLMKALGLRG